MSTSDIRLLAAIYTQAAFVNANANQLLNRASELEQKLFGTTRGDADKDELIDLLEYSNGPHDFTADDVRNYWEKP